MATWAIKVVGRAGTSGTVHATITDEVNVETVEWAMPPLGPTSASFTLHPLHPGAAALAKPYLGGRREVQIYRNGECIWWGVPLGGELVDARSVRFHCVSLLWWFGRRFFGPILNNYWNPNADFEDGLTNWTTVGTTAAVDTAWRAKGTQSAKLTQAAAGTDTYLRRRYEITTTDQPVYLQARAHLHLAGAGWAGPALGERGLYLELQQPAGTLFTDVEPEWAPLTNNTPRDDHNPVEMVAGITVPSPGTFTVEGRLMSPGGDAWWDNTALSPEESTGSTVNGEEADAVLSRIAVYAQDAAWGKSDLLMPVVVEAGTAVSLIRIYQHFDNGNILEAMMEYPAIGACDFDVTWPADGFSSTFRIWPGQRGDAVPGAVLALPGNAVMDSGYSVDGSKIVTKPRRTGLGTGATREVAEVVDTSDMDGHVLESVESAPPEANVDSLWSLAAQDLADNKAPGSHASIRIPAGDVFGEFWLGDTVTPAVDFGWAQESSPRRVKRLTLDGANDSVLVGWS